MFTKPDPDPESRVSLLESIAKRVRQKVGLPKGFKIPDRGKSPKKTLPVVNPKETGNQNALNEDHPVKPAGKKTTETGPREIKVVLSDKIP